MKQLNLYYIGGSDSKPDGKTVTPTDDVTIWLQCGGRSENYTTLAQVLADSTCLSALMADNNAVDYLVRSKSFAKSEALVPTMTSNTTPSGECFASSVYANLDKYKAWRAFQNLNDGQGSNGNSWQSAENQTTNEYIGYKFASAQKVCAVSICNTPNGVEAVKTFKVQAYSNGAWVDLTDIINADVTASKKTVYSFENSNSYTDYRVYILTNNGGIVISINTVQFYTVAEGICDNSTAMSYIGLNNYCANKLLADADWNEAIQNSQYFESVDNVKVPAMTSNTTPSGECFGSTYYQPQFDYYKAFDNDSSTRWASAEGDTTGSYVGYQFTSPVCITKVTIKTTATATGKIQGSNDGVTYDDLASINITTAESNMSFTFANSSKYSYYRFYNTTAEYASPYTLQFYGRADV